MLRRSSNSIVYYQFNNLARCESLVHGVFTRLGGVSSPPYASLNVGNSVGDDPKAVAINHHLIYQALGLSADGVITAYQVQGDNVAVVGIEDGGRHEGSRVRAHRQLQNACESVRQVTNTLLTMESTKGYLFWESVRQVVPQTDALVMDAGGTTLMLRFADCVPILLYDPIRRAIGLAHAGWRGTIEKISQKTVLTMMEACGSRPGDIIAGVGPSIGPCCYKVGEDVIGFVRGAFDNWQTLLHQRRDGSFHFDLWEANRAQLAQVGIREIEVAALCTACRSDEFFSHRAEGGVTGRFAAVLGLKD